MTQHSPSTAEVVVVGGGIAALECVLALRALAGDRVHVTVVAPQPDFVLRPMLVAEPLGVAVARRRPLSRIADELRFRLVRDAVASVEAEQRRVVLHGGGTLDYDRLVLAPGVRTIPAFDDVIGLGDAEGTRALKLMRADILRGDVRSVAFVAPTTTGWLLPLYEAALITANTGDTGKLTLITPEQRPLELFGAESSAKVDRALREAGVGFIGGQQVDVSDSMVHLRNAPGGSVSADRIVSLPLVRGPRITGVPAVGVFGLIPVDPYGRVHGLADVYAAGDVTDYPVKQGGIACQQADTVAAHIAAGLGVDVTTVPLRPVLRATLLTGGGTSIPVGAVEDGWTPAKLPGRHLAPYLLSLVDSPQPSAS
jgi:sulfide:quinone oxidoreductase